MHDAAEDQGGEETLPEIRDRFGEDAAAIVAACNDTFEVVKPPWEEHLWYYRSLHEVLEAGLGGWLVDELSEPLRRSKRSRRRETSRPVV